MRELDRVEIAFVSGGKQVEEGSGGNSASSLSHWWEGIVTWFRDHFGGTGGGGGLTMAQQIQACQDLGRGLETTEVGLMRRMYPGEDVGKVCENAVRNENNWVYKTPKIVCEEANDGTWNSRTNTCVP